MKKKLYLLLSLLCISLIVNSQDVTNGDFEDWELLNTWNLTPTNWATNNTQLLTPVIQDPDAYEGDYAMKVQTGVDFTNPGMAVYGMEITELPSRLAFAIKSFANGFPLMSITVEITFQDASVNAGVWVNTASIDSWSPEEIVFVDNGLDVDYLTITVMALAGDFAQGDGWLSLDDMHLEYIIGVEETEATELITVYPNPTRLETIKINAEVNSFDGVQLFGLNGKLIEEFGQVSEVNIRNLESGNYILRFVKNGNEIAVEQFQKY